MRGLFCVVFLFSALDTDSSLLIMQTINLLIKQNLQKEAAHMQAHQISNAGSKEAGHYAAIDIDERRQRALETQQKLILNEVQMGDPKTCHAFADHCANWLVRDLAYPLCLARIHQDGGLLLQAVAELDALIQKTLSEFCEEEAEKRIAALQVRAAAETLARLEYDHA